MLAYYKSEQHNTIYASYNAELASTQITSVQLENINNKYRELNKKYDLIDKHNKYEIYRNFVAWATGGGSSVGPLTEYSQNEIYKELIKYKDYYTSSKCDKRLYIDLRRGRGYTRELEKIVRNDSSVTMTITLRNAAVKKMRLRVVGHYQGEYMYSMSNLGLLLSYKVCSIVEQNEMRKTRLKRQSGGAFPLAAATIPFLKASLPFLGKAALGGGAGFSSSKIFRKNIWWFP